MFCCSRLSHYYTETVSDLSSLSIQLSSRPETSDAYKLRLYPLTLERGAILSSTGYQERQSLHIVQTLYDEEREQVEEEWKRGRERIRERMLEGIEERRRRGREEKDGEGGGQSVAVECTVLLWGTGQSRLERVEARANGRPIYAL